MNCSCGSPTADGIFLCTSCAETLSYKLAEVDSVVGDLVRAVPRASLTASYGERVSASGSLHAPLPINDSALDAHMALDKYLMVTCIELAKVCGPLTSRTSSGLATYLLTNIGSLRRQDWAGTVHATLAGLLRKAEQAHQPAGERINVGDCGYVYEGVTCTNPLTPFKNQDHINCRVCGTTWDVKERQRDAIGSAWAAIDYPPVVIRALAEYGIRIKPNDFKNWVKLGHLQPAGEEQGRKQYRVSEVWATAKRMQERRKKAA